MFALESYLDSGSAGTSFGRDVVDFIIDHGRRHTKSGCPAFSNASIGQLFQEVKT